MKRLFLFFVGVAFLFAGVACDRHPASQTIPGYQQGQHHFESQQALAPSKHTVRLFSEKQVAPSN